MQFMSIFTWEPEKRDDVVRRTTEWKPPEGLRVINQWTDLTGGRVFVLFEADDPKALLAATYAWCDITKEESVPVMEAEEVMKLLSKL